MFKSNNMLDERVTPKLLKEKGAQYIIDKIKKVDGFYVTNTERDLSQSDFKNRIMPYTQQRVAHLRNKSGFFSLEISGGASVHVDMLRKQINPLEKVEMLGSQMPDVLFQNLCRGVNMFGYRPYPENVIRKTVRSFARYVHVWRVFDFLNYVPNMISVFEEVKAAGCILEPGLCFSTGPEHTDTFYIKKVEEILNASGNDVILGVKNHGGLGTPKRIGDLIKAISSEFPDLVIHYHGHNTDGNEIGRIVEAVKNGAKIVDAGDHAFTGFYGPPPLLTVIDTLEGYGYHAAGVDRSAIIETSNVLRQERPYYKDFESQVLGFDPTVQIHKLPGGATGSSLEQAVKGDFLHLLPEILQNELPKVHIELGNFWSVTPGSQILWTTAVTNVLKKSRYKFASDDLKNLLLGRYGEFPFRKPDDEIYEAVFGPDWKNIVAEEYGLQKAEDIDIEAEKEALEKRLGRKATDDELVLYLQHPNDAVAFFEFEEKFGKTWVLPTEIWFKNGGFNLGETFEFTDIYGKMHRIEIGHQKRTKDGDIITYLNIDYHSEPILTEMTSESNSGKRKVTLSAKEILELAKKGDIRSHIMGNVNEIKVNEGDKVEEGQVLMVLEAMKMLTNILSPVEGTISQICVTQGSKLEIGDELLIIEIE